MQYTRQFTLTAVLVKVTKNRADVSQYACSHIITYSVGDGRCLLHQGMKMCFIVRCPTCPIAYHSLVMSTHSSLRQFLQNAYKIYSITETTLKYQKHLSPNTSEYFIFLFPLEKHKHSNVQNYKFTCSFILVWNLISHCRGRTQVKGVYLCVCV